MQIEMSQPREGVALIRMVAKTNALTEEMVGSLVDAFEAVAEDPTLRAVVLAGGSEYFSSGADRALLEAIVTGEVQPTELTLPRHLLAIPVPVIAAVEGHAIGGGWALALAADMVVLAKESRYAANFMRLGFTPGMGITRLLSLYVPSPIAHELLFTGASRRGAFFEGRSAFNDILPKEEVMTRALDLAADIAEKPRTAVELLKRTLAEPRRRSFEAAHDVETMMHRITFADPAIRQHIEEELG